jgi:hypothetical protein
MLELLANGQQLDTAGVKFNLTLKNALFQKSLDSGYVYDLQFPETDNNKKNLINFANRLETINQCQEPVIESFYNGLKLFEGPFIYSGGKNKLRGSVGVGQGNFLYQAKNKFLHDIDFGKRIFFNEASALSTFNYYAKYNKTYPDENLNFALPYLPGKTDSYLPNGITGFLNKDTFNKWDPVNETYTIDSGGDKGVLVPMLYLSFVLKTLFNNLGYDLTDDFFSPDPILNNLIIFNTVNANGGIPTIDGKPGYYSDITNIIHNRHLPNVLIGDFIKSLQNMLNARFFFNHMDKSVRIKNADEIISSPEYIDLSSKILKDRELDTNTIKGFSLNLTSDDSDTVFKAQKDHEEIMMKLFGGSVPTYSDLPESLFKYSIYYVLDEEKLYVWEYSSETWTESQPFSFLTKYFKLPEDLKIESRFSSLYQYSNIHTASFANPAIDYLDITPRLLFYKGYFDYSGSSYPYAKYSNGLYTLRPESLYLKFWKKYFDFLSNTKIVKFSAILSAADIKNFDFSKKYRINRIEYLVKEIKIPISEREIGVATMKCWKV